MKKAKLLLLLPFIVVPFYIEDERVVESERIEYRTQASSKGYLADVKIEGIDFKFDKNLTEYELTVPYTHDKLKMTYKPENSKDEVEFIGSEELLVGNNSIVLFVTSEDGTGREYDFTIRRNENNKLVLNDEPSIRNGILGNEATNLSVSVSDGEATSLPKDVVEAMKRNSKTITYEWKDAAGSFKASLKIDGTKIGDADRVNPNVKNSITNASLKKSLQETDYVGISTKGTNIPEGSKYSLKVDNKEELYYLYFYDKDLLNKQTLRVNEGLVEFEVKGDTDYAVVGASSAPKKIVEGFSWFWPSLFLTILFFVFLIIMKAVMVKVVRNDHTHREEDTDSVGTNRVPLKKRTETKK